jgi:hypothetical protein
MMTDERRDPLFELLADLPPSEPGEASQRHVRMRCHAALARHRIDATRRHPAWALLDATVLGTMAVYLAGVIAIALRMVTLG